jgi:hypothetical protein
MVMGQPIVGTEGDKVRALCRILDRPAQIDQMNFLRAEHEVLECLPG